MINSALNGHILALNGTISELFCARAHWHTSAYRAFAPIYWGAKYGQIWGTKYGQIWGAIVAAALFKSANAIRGIKRGMRCKSETTATHGRPACQRFEIKPSCPLETVAAVAVTSFSPSPSSPLRRRHSRAELGRRRISTYSTSRGVTAPLRVDTYKIEKPERVRRSVPRAAIQIVPASRPNPKPSPLPRSELALAGAARGRSL